MVRFRVALVVGLALVIVAGASSRSASAATDAVPDAPLTWTRCGALQCATLGVPLEYDGSAPGTVDVAVARRPAGVPSRRIGALVVNPGGPGVPAIDYLRAVAGSLPAALRQRFALVPFDPRGVGRSGPVQCADDLDPLFDESFSPRTDAERTALVDAARAVADSCAARSGDRLAHVSTQNTARDLDRLR